MESKQYLLDEDIGYTAYEYDYFSDLLKIINFDGACKLEM